MNTIESKEPYLKKLDTRGNVYEQFVPDQVLTHNNLNKIVNYFEDQDRLSRIHLSGVGIGCGLNIINNSNNKIEIGQGVGITTDGDLIKAETSEFLYYTTYSDKGEYPLFNGLEVFEIHTQEGAGHVGELPLSSLINLQNYIVIAYVENYTEDEGLCDGFDCDDSGTKVYANLKFLITHKDNFDKLTVTDTIYNNHNVLAYYDGLPELQIPRVLLNKNNTKVKNAIYTQYRNKIVSDNLLVELRSTYITIINKLKHRINFAKFGIREIEINTLFNNLFGTINGVIEKSIQYKYDFVKDLLETYQQIRNELLHIHFECVPAVQSFPKHLLLGTLSEQTRLQTRHQFYPSPIVTSNDEKLMKVRSLVIKFFYQLKQYRIPEAKSAAIKITPSKSYESKLSLRAIPYYYQTKNALVKNWNFNDLQNRKETNQLGYHKNNLKNTPSIQKPLEYTHLDKEFYRIEGHLGKDYRTALNKINKIKTDNNLAFDVKTISVGTPVSSVNLNDIKCENKNYLTLLKTWEKDFSCKAESAITFFSQYSTETVGNNYTSPLAYAKVENVTKKVEVADIIKKRTADAKAKKMYGKTTTSKGTNSPNYATSLEAALDSAYAHVQPELYTSLALVAITESMLESIIQIDKTSDDYFFYIRNPLRIIADLQVLKRDFIQDLNGFYQTNKWTAFNAALNQLCIDLKQAILRLSNLSDNTTFGTRDYDKMYDYFIYELSDFCCLKEKMEWLKEQLDEVRVNLYKDLILSELIQKHPGLEHMAGVPKGGTFLMVYEGGVESIAAKSTTTFKREILFDFALPYMCVSDCPPETIVYQIEVPTTPEQVSLAITPQVFCVPSDNIEEIFTVTPTGGELTSPQAGNFIEGDEVNGYTFNPNSVSDELAGEPITFLVNNEAIPTTEVEIKVYKLPTDDPIVAVVSQVWTAQGLEVEFSINHALITKNYFVYTWKTDTVEVLTPVSVITPNKFLFTDVDNTVFKNIHLEVAIDSNLATCTLDSNTIIINRTRPQEGVDLDIAKKAYCLPTDIATVQFMVFPNDAEVKCDQDNSLIEIESGKYVFAPEQIDNALLGQVLTFTVRDEVPPSNVQIRVYKLPEIVNIQQIGILNWELGGARVEINVTHELENQTYFTYSWEYKEIAITPRRTRNLDFEFLLPEAGNAISGILRLIIAVENQDINCIKNDDTIPINGTRPTTDITTGVDIAKTNFCLPTEKGITDTDITVTPAGAALTSSQAGNFIEGDIGKYTFNPNKVAETLLGKPIKFLVDGKEPNITKEVTVYKLPKEVTPTYNKVKFDSKGITINLNTENGTALEDKGYLEYKWFINGGNGNRSEIAQLKKVDNLFIPSTETSISGELELQLKVKNIDSCTNSYTIPIKETRTDTTPTPTDLTCQIPLQDRFNRLDIKNTIKTVTERTKTIDNFKKLILDPTNALLTGIESTANFTVATINKRLNEIKALRERLRNDFIENINFNNSLSEFLKIDEVLEILALEILRCITRSQFKKTQGVIKEFFAFSNNMTAFRREVKIRRELIIGAYITTYNPKAAGIQTSFTNTFAQ